VARRRQRRPAFRPPRGVQPDSAREQAGIDAGARRLLGAHDARSLAALVHDLRRLREEADRSASDQPSPEALRVFRRAARELAEGERALSLLGGTA
jgi:hypothetical protein